MVAVRRCLGLNQRLGLSRNKVAVPEGVAGTPPFWRGSVLWVYRPDLNDKIEVMNNELSACSSGG